MRRMAKSSEDGVRGASCWPLCPLCLFCQHAWVGSGTGNRARSTARSCWTGSATAVSMGAHAWCATRCCRPRTCVGGTALARHAPRHCACRAWFSRVCVSARRAGSSWRSNRSRRWPRTASSRTWRTQWTICR